MFYRDIILLIKFNLFFFLEGVGGVGYRLNVEMNYDIFKTVVTKLAIKTGQYNKPERHNRPTLIVRILLKTRERVSIYFNLTGR